MVSDINGTVVGIQGNPVVAETLGAGQDGYVLTWDNTDGYIVARPKAGLQQAYFTTSGTWTCPAGVTNVLVIASGGGGGGSLSGGSGDGGSGGGGAIQVTGCVSVMPGTSYSVTIGAGGIGGSGGSNPNYGADGGTTSFSTAFYANGGGGGQWTNGTNIWNGGVNVPGFSEITAVVTGFGAAYGGLGGGVSVATNGPSGGWINWSGNGSYVGGYVGTNNVGKGGGGGGAGPQGNGAAGGAGATTSNSFGSVGVNASNNTGAGGGGGGGGTGSDGHNTAGGNGGSGYLYLLY